MVTYRVWANYEIVREFDATDSAAAIDQMAQLLFELSDDQFRREAGVPECDVWWEGE